MYTRLAMSDQGSGENRNPERILNYQTLSKYPRKHCQRWQKVRKLRQLVYLHFSRDTRGSSGFSSRTDPLWWMTWGSELLAKQNSRPVKVGETGAQLWPAGHRNQKRRPGCSSKTNITTHLCTSWKTLRPVTEWQVLMHSDVALNKFRLRTLNLLLHLEYVSSHVSFIYLDPDLAIFFVKVKASV